MGSRRLRVRECVDLWQTVIPQESSFKWKFPDGKPAHLSIFSGLLLFSLNEALSRYKLTALKIEDVVWAAIKRISITHNLVEITYIFVFKIPTIKDKVAVSEGPNEGEFPYILDEEIFTSNAAIIAFMCDLHPILDYDDDILASFYQLDVIQTINHTNPQGKDYLVEWLFRNHVGLKVAEFLVPSEVNLQYQKAETRANLALKGEDRVACHVCTKPTQTSCRTCLMPYCSIKCQKKDWLAGHTEYCQ
jgi:hypothetical protein